MRALRSRLGRHDDRSTLGIVFVLALLGVLTAIYSGVFTMLLEPDGTTVRARFADTAQLKKGDQVRIRGIAVGTVTGIDLDDGGRTATVQMRVRDDAQPLHADTRADLRWRTVLGGSFAVSLTPGAASAGPLHGTIPVTRTTNQVELEQLIAFARGSSKRGFRTLLAEAPQALADHDAPAATLSAVEENASTLATALSAVRGRGERDLRPLIVNAARTVRALDTPDTRIRALIEGAAITARATAERRADVQQALALAADVQPRVRATLRDLRGTLDTADPLIEHLSTVAPAVAPTLKKLRPTLVRAGSLLRAAQPLLRDLRPTARSLARTAADGAPLLKDITPGVARLSTKILPDLAVRDEVTGRTTYEMIGPTIAALNTAGASFDTEGHLFRFPALGGERAVAGLLPCEVTLTDPEAASLLQCRTIEQALQQYLSYRPVTPTKASR